MINSAMRGLGLVLFAIGFFASLETHRGTAIVLAFVAAPVLIVGRHPLLSERSLATPLLAALWMVDVGSALGVIALFVGYIALWVVCTQGTAPLAEYTPMSFGIGFAASLSGLFLFGSNAWWSSAGSST